MSGLTARAAARAGTVTPSLVAAAAERLAAPSGVVRAALERLDDDRASMRHVAESVAQSPELTAQVMRLGSSVMFGGSAESLDQAVVRIGTENLRALLLAASTYSLLRGSLGPYGLPSMALVRRSNDVAGIAQTIAERVDSPAGPQAYVAGLLHDIGMPILSQVALESRMLVPAPLASISLEREAFGTDHARVGAWIAYRWGLSGDLAGAVHSHHDEEAPDASTARAVWLAAMIVDARTGEVTAAERVADAATRVGLHPPVLEALLMGEDAPVETGRPDALTDREFEVLSLLARGLAPKQVAHELGCSPSTVHNHLHHVYGKLGVSGQAHALLLARERGWV